MNQERSQLYKEFEKEVWLYLDNELSEDRTNYWNRKLDEFHDLHKYIEEYELISELYNEVKDNDITTEKFNLMVDKALTKNSFRGKVSGYLSRLFSNESEFAFGKIAFASALIVMAVVVLLITNRPNPVVSLTKTINAEILDWEGGYIENKIGELNNLLKLAADDDYKKYSKYKLKTKNVSKNIYLIENNILELKKEIINNGL